MIELDDVTKTYDAGAPPVLDRFSLRIAAGEFVALLGPSGAGKSTLLHLMAGLDAPDAGRVVVAGCDLAALAERDRAALRLHRIGFVFQDFKLLPELTVAQNVAWPLEFAGVPRAEVRARVAAALGRVGLPDAAHRSPTELSGGEQQRVALARAIVTAPAILLADEPTGNLDAHAGTRILELLRDLNAAQVVTVVMVTHNPAAAAYAHRAIEVRDGQISREIRHHRPTPALSIVSATPAPARLSWSFTMAYRHVRARWRQMALSVIAVALGVALVVGIQLMNAAVLQSFLDTADAMAGRADLTVSAGPGLTFAEDTAAAVAQVPGVKLAVPLVRGVAFPDDGSGELLTVHGVDLANDAAVRLYHTRGSDNVVQGDLLAFLNAPNNIILGREFADRRGLKVDDTLPLVTPHGVQPFIIKGLLDPEGLAKTLGGRLIVMDLFAAERAFATEGQISQIDVVVEKDQDPQTLRAAIARAAPESLQIEEPALRKLVIRRAVSGFQLMISAFGLLAVVAGFVICYSRLNAVFEARTWQVGLLRAVGLGWAVVFGELLKESLLLGVIGTGLGIFLGSVIARYGLPLLAATTALALRVPVAAVAAPALRGLPLIAGGLVGSLAAVAAAAFPAFRLARTQPVAALRMRGREVTSAAPSHSWALRPLALGAGATLLVVGQQLSGIVALGHITTALLAVAILTAAAPAVGAGGYFLRGLWERMFGPTGRFAAKRMESHPRGSALTVATIAIGLGAVLLFGMLGWSLEQTIQSRLRDRIRGDLVVSSGMISTGYREAPLSDSLLADIGKVPGVATVVGEQEIDAESSSGNHVLSAFDPPCFTDRRVCDWGLDSGDTGDLDRVARGEAVLVSASFANRNATRVGDSLRVPFPQGVVEVKVAGITRGQTMEAVIMSRDVYRRLWNDDRVYLIHVKVSDGESVATVADRLRGELGQVHRVRIRTGGELVDYFSGKAREAFSVLYLMEGITFLLVIVAIGDTLAAGVTERTRRFATIRALGLSRGQVFRLLMLEGGTIGILGLALAVVLGLALGFFWVTIQFPAILGWKLDVHFPYAFAFSAAALTMGLCLLGSLLPSLRAARLPVAKSLRGD